YVSMEPCCRHGKTPPCTDALIEARVRRVVIAVRDPSAAAKGRGLRALRAAGITVDTGVCRAEGDELIAPFRTHVVLKRPYVIAKWAQSLDGRLAAGSGDSMWISCPKSRRSVHRLRARVDAVLVGSGTVLTDDPLLTARDVPLRRRAARVVLDGRLRIRTDCRLVHTANEHKTIVFTTFGKSTGPKAKRLQRDGVEVVSCRSRSGRLVLRDVLSKLARRDVTNLLVEGGAQVLGTLLDIRAIDEVHVFIAPRLIGGADAPSAMAGLGLADMTTTLSLRNPVVEVLSDDVYITGRVERS
ncbi:MAG: bifunctional diaminohydroxyphosphoribosylaminopyrimidine deaminase/5-amino-6-(5-phosphoribosylamino)uracil reductase RibD, partial [Planctomycetes bacterium]|nr:bifunctional diaminohydroxyphosphoribosylaminopyrimidine deaminase/5-amino-6-(5-phosphoribosylamino)uracil reductase RibD [Planctomycetota bacterium]